MFLWIEQRVLDVPEEPEQPTFSDQPEAKDYKETQITHSVTSVQEGAMSMSFASKYFGVPRTTLQYRLSAKCKHRGKIGPYTVFTIAEEQDIVAWLKTMERKGFPVTRSALTYKITSLLETNPRKNPFKNNVPGYGWFRGFLKRHPQLTIRTPESLTLASAKISEKNIREWFQTVKQYLVDHGLIDILMDPSRVLNGDGLGFHLNPNSKKIVATSVAENFPFDEMDNSKQNITVFFTFCADGSAVPPDVILPHKKPNKATIEAFPEDWGIGSSEYGWMDTNNFVLYINKIVYPFLVRKGVTFPVIYFVDGRKSHTVLEAADACKRLGIILIALYRNSTKILQPAYVGILKPLRTKWFDVVEAWKQQDRSAAVTLTKFGSLLKSAMDSSLTASTIISAFAACGLHPYNPDAVDYSNCNAELYQDDSVAPGTPSDTDSGVADKSAKPDIVVPHDVVEKTLEMLGPAKIQLFRDENHENLSHDDRILAFVYKNILCRTNGASNASDDAATKL